MHRIRLISAISGVVLAPVFQICAQTPAPKPGYIRFWNMAPAANGILEVRKANAPKPDETMLVGTAYQYSGYGEYPEGKYRLGVFRKGNDQPLKLFDVDLKPQSYLTILVTAQSIDIFDDTINPKETTGTLTIRNFFPGVTIEASSGDRKIVDALPSGQSHVAAGLPLSRFPITLRTRLPNGQQATAAAEVDFNAWKHATILALPDSYGRFRARATADGKNP